MKLRFNIATLFQWFGLFICFKIAGWLLVMLDLDGFGGLSFLGQFFLGTLIFIGAMSLPPRPERKPNSRPQDKTRLPTSSRWKTWF